LFQCDGDFKREVQFFQESKVCEWSFLLKDAAFFDGIIGISIAIVIGSNLQKFIAIVIGDEILQIIGRKIADDKGFINPQPWSFLIGVWIQ
jgi:hypothetical protein